MAKANKEAANLVSGENATSAGQKSGTLMAALTASSAAAQEAHQKDVRDKLIELSGKTFSTAAAYDNAVMLGGYVAFFALWSGTQANLSAACRLVTAGLLHGLASHPNAYSAVV
jgi:hypothetical protein